MLNEFFRKVTLFSQMTDDQLDLVANITTRKQYTPSTVLFRENEPGNAFYIVYSGSVKIFTTHNGEEKILSVLKAGESFGELSLIDGKNRSASAATLETSILISLSAANFLDLLRNHFDINLSILRELCQRLRDTNQHVNDLTFLDARTRILKNLIQMANKYGTREGTTILIRMVLNYDELCQMSNVQKPVLMQVLRDFQEKRILTMGMGDMRLDLSKLRQ